MLIKKNLYDSEDTLQVYFTQIKAIPLLSFEEELELSKKIQRGDKAAKKRLVEANLRLVVKIARIFLASDVSFMDLIQEGNVGLIRAAEKYDHKKNVRFSTYANWWIRQSISRFLSNKRRVIRLPHRKEEALRKIRKAYHVLNQTLQRQPTTADIADYVGMEAEDVEYILNIANNLISLETDISSDETTTVGDLHEDYTYSPDRELFRQSTRDMTVKFLDNLMERERKILIYRYQLNGGEKQTLKTIGNELGISAETVRQIELRAIKKMRENATELWKSVYAEAM
ncbi:MAG: RNA polymerase sigma factor RpoD/SigA [Treponema sp.]|jgi:RNA polymerase primary sigma factor|nr:RNA polymerase sigma factor RpoD/SigA [Treponema sp.]